MAYWNSYRRPRDLENDVRHSQVKVGGGITLLYLVRWTKSVLTLVLLFPLSSKLRRISGKSFLPASLRSRYCKEEEKRLKREKEVMKDIPGWEVGKSVYNTRKWVPRSLF